MRTPALLDHGAQLLHLPLGPEKSSQPLLGQLPGLFVLAVSQQFHRTTLIRRESNNLSHNRAHKLGLGRRHALAMCRSGGFRDRGRRVAGIHAIAKVRPCHSFTFGLDGRKRKRL